MLFSPHGEALKGRVRRRGVLHHLARRQARTDFLDDVDRPAFINALAHVLHTRQANLSRLMWNIDGVYAQTFIRRRGPRKTLNLRPLQSHPGQYRHPPARGMSLHGYQSRTRPEGQTSARLRVEQIPSPHWKAVCPVWLDRTGCARNTLRKRIVPWRPKICRVHGARRGRTVGRALQAAGILGR